MTEPTKPRGSSNPAPDAPPAEVGGEGAAMPSDSALPSKAAVPSHGDAESGTSCRLVLELLPEAVGGDLDARTDLAIARHVSGCHSCGREWASLRRAHRALTSLREGDEARDGQAEGEGSRLDDAFFAELHQDILGEVQYRQQKDKDQRLFANVQQPPREFPGRLLSMRRIRSSLRGSLLHVVSLAAAVLLGILIGKQFETPAEKPGNSGSGNSGSGNTAIQVRGDSGAGPMRLVGDGNSPRIKRIEERATDAEFRVWLDRQMEKLYLPQPVSPAPLILEPLKGASSKRAMDKKGEDF